MLLLLLLLLFSQQLSQHLPLRLLQLFLREMGHQRRCFSAVQAFAWMPESFPRRSANGGSRRLGFKP
jgi:hypothetical protein